MRQDDLNAAVARATGESLSTIRDLGFSIVNLDVVNTDLEPPRRRRRSRMRESYLPRRFRS